jgi:hypothetical protein
MSSLFRNLAQGVLVLMAFIAPAEAFAGSFHASYYRSVTVRTFQPAPVHVAPRPVAVAQVVPCGRPCAVKRCWGGHCFRPRRAVVRCRTRCGGFSQKVVFRGCRGRRCF